MTLVPFLMIWSLAWVALGISPWLALALRGLNGDFLVRLFIIQHDCGHGSFLRNRTAQDWIGRILGSRHIEFHSQNKTVAASMMAEKKVSGHRSYRVIEHANALTDALELMMVRSGAHRVALFLLALAGTKSGGARLRLPPEKYLIASNLGMKPETLSRSLSRLKAQGVKVQDAEVHIDDLNALRDFAQADAAQPLV